METGHDNNGSVWLTLICFLVTFLVKFIEKLVSFDIGIVPILHIFQLIVAVIGTISGTLYLRGKYADWREKIERSKSL